MQISPLRVLGTGESSVPFREHFDVSLTRFPPLISSVKGLIVVQIVTP